MSPPPQTLYSLLPSMQGSIILLLPRNQKSEIREENSKLIRKRRDKKGGEEKNGKKKGGYKVDGIELGLYSLK